MTFYFILALAGIIGIIVLLREVVCWYWKINEQIRLQKEIIRLLQKLVDKEDEKIV